MDKSSEDWRNECEARYLLTLSLEKRREMLEGISKKRKPEAVSNLKAEILRQFNEKLESR